MSDATATDSPDRVASPQAERIGSRLMAFELDEATRQRILAERAQALSLPPVLSGVLEDDESAQVVCFRCGESRYGIPLVNLKKIQQVQHVAVVPCTPKFVLGLVEVHREVAAVIDLVAFFGFRRTAPLGSPLVVLVVKEGELTLGLACDELLDVVTPSGVQPLPATMSRTEREVAVGITLDKLVVLDAKALVGHARLRNT